MINIVFYGTDEFAAAILQRICATGDFNVLAVITQPDRPSGRNHEIVFSAVKTVALANSLPVLQPDTLKRFESDLLSQADLGVVAEYGLIIPERLLSLPRYGTINLHGSLLPKYRGASPIQASILNGEPQAGVTLMLMDKQMDHGPIISTISTPIDENELFLPLYYRLAQLAADLFLRDINSYISGVLKPEPQDDSAATYCTILNRDDGKIDFAKTGASIYNQYRAFTPWPGLWAIYGGKRVKLGEISPIRGSNLSPGTVSAENGRIYIGCGGNTAIEAKQLQMEGKKMLSASDFLRGERDFGNCQFA